MTTHEHRFYLDQFRGQLLVVGCPFSRDVGLRYDGVRHVLAELAAHGAKLVVVTADAAAAPDLDDAELLNLWEQLDVGGIAETAGGTDRTLVGATAVAASLDRAATVAARLRANKLVLLTSDWARADTGGRVDESYMSIDIDETHDGAVELSARALRAGVGSVNVVDADGLADELLTYAGAGTLYTAADYVTIDRVGFGDFAQVRRLIKAGVEDGFLKPRSEADIRRLIVNGYGARVDRDHVAGFAALLVEPYAAERMAEVTALATISRFAGGGVGSRLVDHLAGIASGLGLAAVFATTTSTAAVAFFEHVGFEQVADEDIPAAKWHDYDAARRAEAVSLVRPLPR